MKLKCSNPYNDAKLLANILIKFEQALINEIFKLSNIN